MQSKQVDQYDVEADRWRAVFCSVTYPYPCVTYHRWKDYFPSLRHCRVAHGAVASGDTIYVTGGSAKANANFGPGWYYLQEWYGQNLIFKYIID